LGLGHLRSKKALPVLRALLEKCQLDMKIKVAFAIFQITGDAEMVDIALEKYASDKRYLVAYNATRQLGRSTDEVIERHHKKADFYKFSAYPSQCSFLHDRCIETEHYGRPRGLAEDWSSRLYEPGTFLGSSG
jgi:hypothetical protein